ncbi:MAG: hypothetical protein AAGA03_20235, partial [Planctomycetota bacterium]
EASRVCRRPEVFEVTRFRGLSYLLLKWPRRFADISSSRQSFTKPPKPLDRIDASLDTDPDQ